MTELTELPVSSDAELEKIVMARVICLFNHKGGVSKTTTAFNLGWMLARKKKRVLLVDCDPQCNLTGMVLGLENLEIAASIQGTKDGKPLNIKEGLAPAFKSRPSPILAVECISIPKNKNLFLMPGHIGLSEYEVTLGVAQELSGSLVTLRNLPSSLRYLIDITAKKYKIDIVVVDMSPSLPCRGSKSVSALRSHPPPYAALNQTSSPRFPLSSAPLRRGVLRGMR